MTNRSVMAHNFSQVPTVEIPRSSFDRSHALKTTFDAGHLVPIFVDEALPGDTFNLKMTAFARLATPIHPIMDNMFMETFFFSVPIRLIWSNWQRFNGEQTNPGDPTNYEVPQLEVSPVDGWGEGSLEDYFGLPTKVAGLNTSCLWHRAYNLVFREWFRDQNLIDSPLVATDNGPDPQSNYKMLQRGKRHDYFTSALPWPQKGDAVTLPLGTQAPVLGIGKSNTSFPNAGKTLWESSGTSRMYPNSATINSQTPDAEWEILGSAATGAVPQIFADLTNATAITINQLRQGFQIQRLFERDARGGTRYTEIIRSHFGVVSPDARLQRPEYLGGGTSMVNVTPIAQTGATGTDTSVIATPQANLAGVGTAQLRNHGFTKSFTEHCVLIGLVNVRADLTYQQGLNRMWSRRTRYDYFWPSLAHLGEQSVLNKEIYAQGNATDDLIFGYQERYAEMRYKPSQITGRFRSNATQPLHAWHLSQNFASLPSLNEDFITDKPPVDRVIAVNTEPHFLFDSHFSLKCARPMPLYGVPGLIDHF